MEFWGWVTQNAFDLISAAGIIGGLIFTAVSLHSETKTRRVANLIALTQNHREMWSEFYKGESLSRFADTKADVQTVPLTLAEENYGKVLITHLASFYRAMKSDLTIKPEGVRQDIHAFFSMPVPRAIWEKFKPVQDEDFVTFVEGSLR